MKILGISAYYHDSAAVLLVDGLPVAAAQEERFSRIKNDSAFPQQAIDFCLQQARLTPDDLDAVIFYDKPVVKFERLLSSFLARAPKGYSLFLLALPSWFREKLWIPSKLRKALPGCREYLFASHHQSHAAAAFYASSFERAAILTVDGVGEWATCSYAVGDRGKLQLLKEIRFPHSIGLLYSAFTAYLGFKVNEGEYKVMGLAPFGKPRYLNHILEKLVSRHGDGSFCLNLDYFAYLDRPAMTSAAFHTLFDGEPRVPDGVLEERHFDVAASIQRATEILLLDLVQEVHRQTGEKNLCLAGGVALNSVANGRLLNEGPFERIWIQPAAGDAGGALGAAYIGHIAMGGEVPAKSASDLMSGALLGPEFTELEMQQALDSASLGYTRLAETELLTRVTAELASGRVIGWFQGKMEFGPRALGSRSILADPRVPEMQRILNQKIKFREGFRPFAPMVLESRSTDYFNLEVASPYMLLVAQVAERQLLPVEKEQSGLDMLNIVRSTIPAVTHVDGSARVQTVNESQHPLTHRLLQEFERLTGCPVLVNTSFNVKDEPIVCTPQDAVECFLKSGIDGLAIGPFWVNKK